MTEELKSDKILIWGLQDENGVIVDKFMYKGCAIEWKLKKEKVFLSKLKVVKLKNVK